MWIHFECICSMKSILSKIFSIFVYQHSFFLEVYAHQWPVADNPKNLYIYLRRWFSWNLSHCCTLLTNLNHFKYEDIHIAIINQHSTSKCYWDSWRKEAEYYKTSPRLWNYCKMLDRELCLTSLNISDCSKHLCNCCWKTSRKILMLKTFLSKIKNIFKRREECDIYLTHVCRHRWRRKSSMKIDEIGAFIQHYGFDRL